MYARVNRSPLLRDHTVVTIPSELSTRSRILARSPVSFSTSIVYVPSGTSLSIVPSGYMCTANSPVSPDSTTMEPLSESSDSL